MMYFHLFGWLIGFLLLLNIFLLVDFFSGEQTNRKSTLIVSLLFSPIIYCFMLGIYVLIFEPEEFVAYTELKIDMIPETDEYMTKTQDGYLIYDDKEYIVVDDYDTEVIEGAKENKLITKSVLFSSSIFTKYILEDKTTYELYLK